MLVASSPIPSAAAWRRTNANWTDPHKPGPADAVLPPEGLLGMPLASALLAAADRHASTIAFLDNRRALDFKTLFDQARAFASQALRLAPANGAVAVITTDQVDLAIAQVGLILAGRVGLFLQATHPAARLSAILADAAPAAVIGDARDDLAIPQGVRFMTMGQALAAPPIAEAMIPADPRAPMAVYFTSGSTGRPRGYARAFGSSLARAAFQWRDAGLRPGEHVCSLNDLAAGTTGTWLLSTLLTGATSSVANPAELGLRGLSTTLANRAPAVLITIPSLMRVVMQAPGGPDSLSHTRLIYSVSEPLIRDELIAWRARLPEGVAVMMSFGMTECSSIAGWFAPPDLASLPAKLPIGFPRINFEFALIDDDGAPVAVGERGLLWIRGAGVAVGEWRGGGIAAPVGLPDPDHPGEFIFPTNDIFRLRPDGMLEHVGRADDVVKLRGNRVDLAEVELALRATPNVADAGVTIHAVDDHEVLVAFVIGNPEARPTAAQIIAHLRERLPSAMIPGRIVTVRDLPRLPNGKLDRQALPTLLPPGT